ncbi:RNA polymerase sigma factor [Nesterenkonia muleiensis]|uniref:RNA polymerase sigma factor n=1 Tax=Nesterenkonia muleiensis TaxID=2282648 RepID=UPI000E75DCAE|nr:RNA polymerase sigma factor [Nesterenkonia muleiensis]
MTGDLQRALSEGNIAAARRAAAQLNEPGDADDALALLAQLAPQSPHALELLIETLDATGVVRRFASGALLDKSAVDDVSQDALISIAESVRTFDGRGKVTTWVHSIVRRRVVDHLRRQRDSAPLPDDAAAPAARMSSMIATRATVQDALADLPELYRRPVTLRDLEGRPYAEIAETLGRSLGTVKSQVSRGRAMVAARLQESSDAGGSEGG